MMGTHTIKEGAGNASADWMRQSAEAEIAASRIVGVKEAAAYCGFSVPHFRRLYYAGKVPPPIKLSDRKVGWRIGTLVDFIRERSA